MNMHVNRTAGGVGFFGLLQLIFVVLKLCNVIHWHWVWVLTPAIVYVLLIVLFVLLIVIATLKEIKAEKRGQRNV